VGFRVVGELSKRLGIPLKKRLFHPYLFAKTTWRGGTICLVEPLTFMNASGRAFPDALRVCGVPPQCILVVCDSLDLSTGNCRFRVKGGAGGHKGLESVIRNLGTDEFMRLLIGIGRPKTKAEVVEYVLGVPNSEDALLIEAAVAKATDAVLSLAVSGPERVMNEINRKEPPS
jgi:PTH1 family peptidyl-tRNA hydrolase